MELIMKLLFTIVTLFSTIAGAQEEASTKSSDRKMKVGVYYFSGDTAAMKDTKLGTASGSMELKFAPGLGVSYDYIFIDSTSKWDWSIGGSYDFAKKFKTSSMTLSGTEYTFTPKGSPTMAVLAFNGNAIYKVDEKLSVPFGFNISRPILAGESDNAKAAGGIGYQIGAEYSYDEKSSIDLQYRTIYITGNQSSGSDTLEYGTGFLSGFQLGYKYSF